MKKKLSNKWPEVSFVKRKITPRLNKGKEYLMAGESNTPPLD